MRNTAWYVAGLILGAANTLRHRLRGYSTPRSFSPLDIGRTVDYAFQIVDRLESKGEIDWQGKRVLEIGPGSDMTTGAIMLARGATSYDAVDLFDNRDQAPASVYERLADRLGSTIDPSRLRFTQCPFPALPGLVGPFDLIVSNACLEHVADVTALFARLRELATPTARMVHHVDAKAHMRGFRERDPLNILRYGDGVYRALLDFPGAPNRLRTGDFEVALTVAGWVPAVVAGRLASADYLRTVRVSRRFASRTDLGALTFTLVAVPSGGSAAAGSLHLAG